MGKNAGDDLAEGKPTLPLLYAMWHGDEAARKLIREAIEQGDGREHGNRIVAAMHATGALSTPVKKRLEAAQHAREGGLAVLPDQNKQALIAHLISRSIASHKSAYRVSQT